MLLGVTDDGKVVGLPPKSIDAMIRNFVNVMNDPNLFDPVFTLYPQEVVYKGKHLIHVRVPESAEVHRFKGKCYARVHDEGDIFRLTVPLDAEHSPEGTDTPQSTRKTMEKGGRKTVVETVVKTVVKKEDEIVAILAGNPSATRQQLATATGLTVRGVEWNLKELKESGRIRRIGPDKGGHWEVIR